MHPTPNPNPNPTPSIKKWRIGNIFQWRDPSNPFKFCLGPWKCKWLGPRTINKNVYRESWISIQHQLVKSLKVSAPTPNKYRWVPPQNVGKVPLPLNALSSFVHQYRVPDSKYTGGECPHTPMEWSTPTPKCKCWWVPSPLKCVIMLRRTRQRESIGLSQRSHLYLLRWLYSFWRKLGIHKIWTSNLNLIMKVKVNCHKATGILTKVFCTSGPNLVILPWTGFKLSRWQARDWHTHTAGHTHSDAGNDNTRSPKLTSGRNVLVKVVKITNENQAPGNRGVNTLFSNEIFKFTFGNLRLETVLPHMISSYPWLSGL